MKDYHLKIVDRDFDTLEEAINKANELAWECEKNCFGMVHFFATDSANFDKAEYYLEGRTILELGFKRSCEIDNYLIDLNETTRKMFETRDFGNTLSNPVFKF